MDRERADHRYGVVLAKPFRLGDDLAVQVWMPMVISGPQVSPDPRIGGPVPTSSDADEARSAVCAAG